jgi:hypothetical protein
MWQALRVYTDVWLRDWTDNGDGSTDVCELLKSVVVFLKLLASFWASSKRQQKKFSQFKTTRSEADKRNFFFRFSSRKIFNSHSPAELFFSHVALLHKDPVNILNKTFR